MKTPPLSYCSPTPETGTIQYSTGVCFWKVRKWQKEGIPLKIGILSDTHNLLRPEVLETLRGCSVLLHAGDVCEPRILNRLREIAPTHAVRGNADSSRLASLPVFLDLTLSGLRICMAHKRKDLPADLSCWDLAVFGHSHQYLQDQAGHTVLLNPGSCGPRRFRLPITMAILTTEDDGFSVEKISISRQPSDTLPDSAALDMRRIVESVMCETERGISPADIAARHALPPALAEQIARLYVTHPGVNADDILTKMGL